MQQIHSLVGKLKVIIEHLPIHKQHKAIQAVENIYKKKDQEILLKELTYHYNFLKLTNPAMNFDEILKYSKMTEEELMKEAEIFANEKMQEETKKEETKLKTGTYIFKNGQLVEGHAEKKKEVDYSNWYAGNTDPEDMNRHKQLLDRQHFGGPFWEGKPKPKSILNDEDPHTRIYSDEPVEKEVNPNMFKQKEQRVEKVKR